MKQRVQELQKNRRESRCITEESANTKQQSFVNLILT